jgi:hypothetical protein
VLVLVRCTRDLGRLGLLLPRIGSRPVVALSQRARSCPPGGRLLAGAKSANGVHFDGYRIAMAERHGTVEAAAAQPLFVDLIGLIATRRGARVRDEARAPLVSSSSPSELTSPSRCVCSFTRARTRARTRGLPFPRPRGTCRRHKPRPLSQIVEAVAQTIQIPNAPVMVGEHGRNSPISNPSPNPGPECVSSARVISQTS